MDALTLLPHRGTIKMQLPQQFDLFFTVIDLRVGHTMDVLFSLIFVFCHSD